MSPYFEKLQDEFTGKNIVFVSISVDKDRNTWKKFVIEKQLKGVQLWAGKSKVFSDDYMLYGIPRFVLIDKEGKIIEADDTFGPASEKTKEMLNKLDGI